MKHLSFLLISAVAVVSAPVHAQQGEMTRARALEQAETRFTAMDTDKDGVVTEAEVEASVAKRAAESGRPASPDRAKTMFAGMDSDKDGKVTAEEARAAAGARFDAADTNKNGVMDADEQGGRPRGGS